MRATTTGGEPRRGLVLAGAEARRNSAAWRRLWRAVAKREALLDGAFVYGVRSTRVYCRPSCPARRPRRAQVVFFPAPEAAERQGFRACLRCQPQQVRHNRASELIARVCSAIEAHADAPPRLAALAAEAGISPLRLRHLFVRLLGVSPRSYADAVRLRRFKKRLQEGDNVTTALYEAGYGSASRLYESSNRQLGMTPATYRRRGRGMQIGFTIALCPLGRLLVAGTARGISAVYLGDADAPLEAALRREYPEARVCRNPAQVSRWVRQIVRHLAGKQPRLRLPLDVAATAFQRRVWEALLGIPYGATRSYSEISRQIGRPKSVRAVARACATNPASIVIPCHRVVGKDEGLRGYRWGIGRKRALLALEQRHGEKRHGRKPAPSPRRAAKRRNGVVRPGV